LFFGNQSLIEIKARLDRLCVALEKFVGAISKFLCLVYIVPDQRDGSAAYGADE
jgi:hypothetical protein